MSITRKRRLRLIPDAAFLCVVLFVLLDLLVLGQRPLVGASDLAVCNDALRPGARQCG
jgi:hypothetical protein